MMDKALLVTVRQQGTQILLYNQQIPHLVRCWKPAGEFIGLVWCYMVPLWQVYWERVGPLFDLESEYWARQDKDEGTLADCLTVMLAVPAALLFFASYIVALRMGLLCMEKYKTVREWAQDVYWHVMEE